MHPNLVCSNSRKREIVNIKTENIYNILGIRNLMSTSSDGKEIFMFHFWIFFVLNITKLEFYSFFIFFKGIPFSNLNIIFKFYTCYYFPNTRALLTFCSHGQFTANSNSQNSTKCLSRTHFIFSWHHSVTSLSKLKTLNKTKPQSKVTL